MPGLLRSYRRLVVVLDGSYMPGLLPVLIGRSPIRQWPLSFPFWASVFSPITLVYHDDTYGPSLALTITTCSAMTALGC